MGRIKRRIKKVVSKPYYRYGNYEYPKLKHWEEVVVEEKGNYRLTEKRWEYLHTDYGYEPDPEVAETRKLQRKLSLIERFLVLFTIKWVTVKKYTYRIDSNQWIKEACFGTKYDSSESWEKVGLNKII